MRNVEECNELDYNAHEIIFLHDNITVQLDDNTQHTEPNSTKIHGISYKN